MIDHTKAHLFRATQRKGTETNCWRSLHSFDPQGHCCAGSLRAVTEHTIAGKAAVHLRMEQDTWLLLVPAVGAIAYADTLGGRSSIAAGQAYRCFLPAGAQVTLSNPYTDHLVNVLQFNLLLSQPCARTEPCIVDFDITANPDCLVTVFSGSSGSGSETGNYILSIGKFAG